MLNDNRLLLTTLQEGTTSISNLLLENYRKLSLTDQEMMLIIHITYYQSKGNFFPSISLLQNKMDIKAEDLMRILQRLVRDNFIQIEGNLEEQTSKISEVYNLTPLYKKLINVLERDIQVTENEQEMKKDRDQIKTLFKSFEQEFGRPLSPMEIEMINTWIDQDRYSYEIIIYALKEAVFSNKLNFRYIDRILFEWDKKNLKTLKQIKEHIKGFRATQRIKSNKDNKETNSKEDFDFEFYNWLEENND